MRERKYFYALTGLALALLCLPGKGYGQSTADLTRKLQELKAYPDLILVNAKIHTMDANLTEPQAMAVKNTRILALGTNDQIRFLAGPNTEVIDAKGRTVLPGLIDSHTHPHLWAVEHWLGGEGDFSAKQYKDPQLQIVYAKGNDQATVLRELERLVAERARVLGPGKWIWVNLFGGKDLPESRKIVYGLFPSGAAAGGGGPSAVLTREFLDKLAPNNPLMVMVGEAIGPAANNSKARDEMMKYLGTEMVGLQARTSVLYDILFKDRLADAADFVKREILQCLAPQGITTFANHYYGAPSIMKVYNYLYKNNDLPVRWAWFMGGSYEKVGSNSDPDPKAYYNTLGDFRGIGNDYIWNAGIGNEGWEWGPQGKGGIGTCTGASPLPGATPGALYTPCNQMMSNVEQYGGYQNVKAALQQGLRIGYLHHYSDGTFDALFKVIEDEIAAGRITLEQVRALRISTEHNPMIRPDQFAKIAKYNIMPGFNGYQVQGDIKGGAFLKNYGEQYMTWMAPMKGILTAGGHPVFNTDAHLHKVPPESKDMDYPEQWDGNIWGFIEFFVTRKMPHENVTYNINEAMDRNNMMKAATIWGAEQVLREDQIGSLEVGKLADFVVIDKDFFSIPGDQIRTIKTMLTVLGGKTIFKSPNF
jgi:predicted amidohydrolase YtcJ